MTSISACSRFCRAHQTKLSETKISADLPLALHSGPAACSAARRPTIGAVPRQACFRHAPRRVTPPAADNHG
ncbi:hypothetical protein EMIT0111MI5_140018 [Burkholderia sp. IT-111MI5]